MNKENVNFDVGIIGCGPRGLSALESLYSQAAKSKVLPKVLLFEVTDYPGAGPIYDLHQPDSNWLNVSIRTLAVPPRKEAKFEQFSIPGFPDFQQWSGYSDSDEAEVALDEFPLRSKLGAYLHERYQSIASVLIKQGLATMIQKEVDRVDVLNGVVQIGVVGGQNYLVMETVLCIGHQPISFDEQMTAWNYRVAQLDAVVLFTQPYPVAPIIKLCAEQNSATIAIRGFGLAMIDVARALSEGLGGKFVLTDEATRTMEYKPSGQEPNLIIPFSLDGLPMAPKPLHKKIDCLYAPTEKELSDYESSLIKSIESKTALDATDFLIHAIAPIAARKFIGLGTKAMAHELHEDDIINSVTSWLSDAEFSHPLIISIETPAGLAMKKFIDMATGIGKVSLDFCIGHVWRHCQPTMYRLLSFAPLSDDRIADIVQLDERLKRYSYGPPVDSLQQMLALVNAGIISLDFVNDPDIALEEGGWKFGLVGKTAIAEIMVNSVLDAPQILKVVSPLPKGLINNRGVEPLHDKLGLRTKKNALVESKRSDNTMPVALMGRLAKGTLIGVDAIAECFGKRSEYWAAGVVKRL